MTKTLFLLVIVLSMVACHGSRGANEALETEIPADEATAEERQLINEIKADIKKISDSFGVPLDLDKLSIVVTSRQDIVTAGGNSGFTGLCILDQNKNGEAIVLYNEPLRFDLYKADNLKKSELAPQTFRTLLHEIGHCYFGREHESEVLQKKGKQMRVHQTKEYYDLPFVTASVMDNSASSMIPYSLKNYYIAEILGVFRASSLDEVARFINAELADRSE